MIYRIGNGLDIHNLKYKKNTLQTIGGVKFKLNYKIIAHSDGDILIHALSDAILGALNLNDIGYYFNDNDIKNKNLDSLKILDFAIKKMNSMKFEICNVNINIICEKIYFKNLIPKIKDFLILFLNNENINIQAKRFERKINQIQCNCIILLKSI